MISLFLTASVLLSQPTREVKLASPTLAGVNMSAQELTFYTDHLAQQIGFRGLRVITPSEIQNLLGLERQKALLGCSEDASACQAELANALGVDGLVTGSIGKVGSGFQINLKIIKTEDGTPLAAWSGKAGNEDELLENLTRAAKLLASGTLQKLRPGAVAALPPGGELTEASEGGARRLAWIPAAGGAALAGVGTVLLLQGAAKKQEILQATTEADARSARDQGVTLATAGAVLISAGAAALVGAGGMYLFGGPSASVAVVPGPEPAVAVTGRHDLLGGAW